MTSNLEGLRTAGARRSRRPKTNLTHKLGAEIVAGRYQVGDLLARELEAKSDHNVSRGVYREAILTLAAKGLVRSKTNTGTCITDPDHWTLLDPQVLRWIQSVGKGNPLAIGLLELCRSVEPVAASIAAARREYEDTTVLREASSNLAQHSVVSDVSRNAEFLLHSALLKATHNAFFVSLASAMHVAIALYFPAPGQPQDVQLHHQVVDAICNQDSRTATLATQALWQRMTTTASSAERVNVSMRCSETDDVARRLQRAGRGASTVYSATSASRLRAPKAYPKS